MPPLHVLFVDDDSDESYLFNEALEHSGLQIELSQARNGNDLLNVLVDQPIPDLIFMDINMPYKDGFEALAEIKNREEYNKIPVVIYSTTKNSESINKCYEKGANLFIVKPNDFDGMVSVVKKVFTVDWKNPGKRSREEFVITE
jgi:CheY-like chemotaxis protein